ncbi:MAG: hypothetical protein F4053_01360 [Proteobacteria bacterium]|nr:hypothetical protein [Pseudomonadota bacterium]
MLARLQPGSCHGLLKVALRYALPLMASAALAQEADHTGKWVLALDPGSVIDYGILEIAETQGEWQVYIDGGSVNLLSIADNRIAFDFDWTDSFDLLHVTELSGELLAGRIGGSMTEDGDETGTWYAEPWVEHPDTGADPAPFDISGMWRSVSRGTHKDAFDLTPAGAAINDAYDRTLDDPHLRCVSGGVIRIEDAPRDYEIIDRGDHVLILYDYFGESRRIWMDGRPFPERIEGAYLPMGYSIGHWEGSMLVVETRGMKPTVWDAAGMPVSASAVLIERKYLDEAGRLHTDYELNDPANYERPVYRHAYRERSPETVLGKYACDPHAFYRSLVLEGKLEEYWRSRSRF